jgi:hypothetical protein
VRLSAELDVDGRKLAGVTRNLSSGGVCVEIDRPIAEGRELGLVLFVVEDDVETEGSSGLALRGSVQWTAEADRGYAIGIKFGALTPAQSTQLQNAMRALGIS